MITPLPTPPPSRNDPATFADRGDLLVAALPIMVNEINSTAADVTSNAAAALVSKNAADAAAAAALVSQNAAASSVQNALAAGNYKGTWTSLGSSAVSKPASVSHNNKFWALVNNLANASTSQPGVTSDWTDLTILNVSQWVTKTSNYTAVAGDNILASTGAGSFTITLPSTPLNNDTVAWKDYSGTFSTNKITFNRNGNNIMGLAQNMDVSTNNFNGKLTFISATNDWRF